jgi:hypothetical protein
VYESNGLCIWITNANISSDINLNELQKTLDTQSIELVDSQKESIIGRKALAEKTKGSLSSS